MVTGQKDRKYSVGIVGGGQLAWMMAEGAQRLDIELNVQTPKAEDPAGVIASNLFFGPIADAATTAKLAASCDVITFENEFIDLPALREIEQNGVRFSPSLDSLEPLLDKYTQRQYCDRIGLPSPPFVTLESASDKPKLAKSIEKVGLPLALKTRRHGYDGQGTFILKRSDTVEAQWTELGYQPVLLEAFVSFEKELAVMVARSGKGEVVVYPVVETVQINQVCRRVIAPAQVTDDVAKRVSAIASDLVNALDYIGVLGIELFLRENGEVLINEIAPRTHNSGHYTLDACETSQFEQQLRAVCDLPLGSAKMTASTAIMLNLLGTDRSADEVERQKAAISAISNAHLYWYGKSESQIGRKMGHVTLLTDTSDSAQALFKQADEIERLWYETDQDF